LVKSEVGQSKKIEYLKWYRACEEALGEVVPHLNDEEVLKLVSPTDWLAFPFPYENDLKDVANRPDPHIDITLREEGAICIGIRCNTKKSVEKLKNILHGYHAKDKTSLIEQMRGLDDDFETLVFDKKKESNFAQSPQYECLYANRSNQINEQEIDKIFRIVKDVNETGVSRMRDEGRTYPPEAPVIDIVRVKTPLKGELFKQKASKLKHIFQICINIKTESELRQEMKKMRQKKPQFTFVGYECPKCQTIYSTKEFQGSKFCLKCGTWLKPKFV